MFILHIPNFDMVFIIHFRCHISLYDQGVEIVNWHALQKNTKCFFPRLNCDVDELSKAAEENVL